MKTAIIIAAALTTLSLPALASDKTNRCPQRPAAEWLSVDQVTAKLKEQGYIVRKVERSHGCYEVKATDAKGVPVEVYVDPANATIVKREGRS